MTSKLVMALREETLRTAVRRMTEHAIHGVLIAPVAPGRGYSILTGKDCIEVLCNVGNDALDDLCVEDAMTCPALTVAADSCAMESVQLMRHAGVRMAPVVDANELVGVFSFTDVLKACR